MASVQYHKPSDQTNHQEVQSSNYHQKATTTQIRHNKNQTRDISITDKVKEMAHSARKMFNHHEQSVPDHMQKPTTNYSSGTAHSGEKTEKKKNKVVKHTEGHEGHCMSKMLDHVKNMTRNNKKNKEGKHGGSISDSGSSSDSDHDTARKKD